MTEKCINLSSQNNFLSGSVFVSFEENSASVSADIKLKDILSKNNVLRAYFVYENLDMLNIGVMDTNYNFSKIEKTLLCPDGMPWGIIITDKDTVSESETIVATGYFYEKSVAENISEATVTETADAMENAKKLLSRIQNASETKDQGISKNNCINMIKKAISSLPKTNQTVKMFDTFYKVEKFCPVVNLSALKFLMFEGNCAYSFYESGHYFISLKENYLLVAFAEYDNRNPFFHAEDFSFKFQLDSKPYYGVIIELSDEGQYLIV